MNTRITGKKRKTTHAAFGNQSKKRKKLNQEVEIRPAKHLIPFPSQSYWTWSAKVFPKQRDYTTESCSKSLKVMILEGRYISLCGSFQVSSQPTAFVISLKLPHIIVGIWHSTWCYCRLWTIEPWSQTLQDVTSFAIHSHLRLILPQFELDSLGIWTVVNCAWWLCHCHNGPFRRMHELSFTANESSGLLVNNWASRGG